MSDTTATSVIHDIGYRRYLGPRLGRAYAVRSLYVHSLRTAFGLGRSAAAKIFPWGIFGLLVTVAAILAAIRSQTGQVVLAYWQFPVNGLNLLAILFCAVIAPELVSRDVRGGVLPLYFSRPLTRSDYPAAKWAAMVSAVFLLLLGPLLVLYLGAAFTQSGLTGVWHESVDLGKGLAVAAVVSVLFGSIALLVSSLAGNRAVAAALTVAAFLVTTPVYGVLRALSFRHTFDGGEMTAADRQLGELAGLVSPTSVAEGVAHWWFNPGGELIGPYGPVYLAVFAGLVVVCLLFLLLRYRKVAR